MGGGTSGLFFGTKGSKQDYQYSLFPDSIRKDVVVRDADAFGASGQIGNGTRTRSKHQLITVEMVLQKCQEYHSGHISAVQLVEWLSLITSSHNFRLSQQLRSAITEVLEIFLNCLRLIANSSSAFDKELQEFEKSLRYLRK